MLYENEYGSVKWFVANHLMNPLHPRTPIILEGRLKDLTGLGENALTLEECGKLMGVSRSMVRINVHRMRRLVNKNIERLLTKSREKVIIKEVERVPEPVQIGTNLVPFIPIDTLDISVRAANVLRYLDITTVEQLLTQSSERDLMKTPNFGRKSLNEIKAELEKLGLKLQERAA